MDFGGSQIIPVVIALAAFVAAIVRVTEVTIWVRDLGVPWVYARFGLRAPGALGRGTVEKLHPGRRYVVRRAFVD